MNKVLSIITIVVFSFISSNAFCGDDGKIEINGEKNGKVEVKDCFDKVNRGIFSFNQVLGSPLGYAQEFLYH